MKKIMRTKLVFGLLLAFFVASQLSQRVFLANTPRLKPEFISAALVYLNIPGNAIANIAANHGVKKGSELPMADKNAVPLDKGNMWVKQYVKGAYAAENKLTGEKWVIFDNNAKVREYDYKIDGTDFVLYEAEK